LGELFWRLYRRREKYLEGKVTGKMKIHSHLALGSSSLKDLIYEVRISIDLKRRVAPALIGKISEGEGNRSSGSHSREKMWVLLEVKPHFSTQVLGKGMLKKYNQGMVERYPRSFEGSVFQSSPRNSIRFLIRKGATH